MVEEFRKVIFSKEEIVTAIDSYRRVVQDFLPNGEILRCELGPNSSYTINLNLAYGSKSQQLEFNFNLADLLGPVIQYCVENNIMLPRNARKCIKMEGDRIALYIVMEGSAYQPINKAPPSSPPGKK